MTPTTIQVLCAGAVRHAFTRVAAQFEHDTGHRVHCQFAAVGTLLDRYRCGTPADLLVLNRPALEQLAAEGKVDAPPQELGTVGVGIAVQRGGNCPDLSSAGALRAALLDADSISYGDPEKGDSSGVHFAKVLRQLGIDEAVAGKTRLAPAGLAVAEMVRDGVVAMGATQASVIAACEGVVLAGMLPTEVQHLTTYACSTESNAGSAEAARELTRFLSSPFATEVFGQSGFSRAQPVTV